MKKILWLLVFLIIVAVWGFIWKDWYDTQQLTEEGADIPTTSQIPYIWNLVIGEIAPVEKISNTKQLNIDVKSYKNLLTAYDKIKSIPKYKFNPNKNLKQNIIITPTIYSYIK